MFDVRGPASGERCKGALGFRPLLQHVCCFAKTFGVSIVSKKQSTCTCFTSFNCVSTKFDHYLDYAATAPWRHSNNTRCRMVLHPLHSKVQGNLKASLRRMTGSINVHTPFQHGHKILDYSVL